uniref:Late embryogenesis abundant protein LEA-2 subgroup domain-containing protein n=1 Tax=Kalanchoe fedtschenkoi TaxID=63787 RepID=A0A7N0TR28_KALFE
MHAKTDSDATSVTHSSPPRSPPRRPLYYVQSPSRDSHDYEKATTATSFHSTPVISPAGSPPHSHSNSSLGRHSRDSSSTRFSGSLKPHNSRSKVNPDDPAAARKSLHKPWGAKKSHFDAIEEEGLLDDDESVNRRSRRCYILAFLVGFVVLFALFSLILYAASKPQKPKITVKSIQFDHVGIQAGSDDSGVATDMLTLNSTVKLAYRNTATFFGVHVTSTPLDLTYSQLTIASGTIDKFYQSRKSQRTLSVNVLGSKVPLYGSGAGLSSSTGKLTVPVNLTLSFTVRSRAYVLGKLVKPKFYKKVNCKVKLDPKKMNAAVSLKDSCTYRN